MRERQPHTHATCGFCLRPNIIRSRPHEKRSGQPICPDCLADWHMPQQEFKKAVKKQAVAFYDAVAKVQDDPGFAGLSEEVRNLLAELLQGLKKPEKDQ